MQNINIDLLPICVVIYRYDEDGDFIFEEFNKKAQETENIQKEQLLGYKVHLKFPGIKPMGLLDVFYRVFKSSKEEVLEIGLYEDSRIYGWRRNVVSKMDKERLLVVYEDISKENELIEEFEHTLAKKTQELKKQKAAFEELFEKSSDGILILEDNHFVQCNQTIVDMLGYDSKEEILQLHPADLSPEFQPDGQRSLEKSQIMIQLAMQKGSHSFEWKNIHASGKDIWVEVTLTPISLNERDVVYVTWRDISQRKEMENKIQNYTALLEASNRELEELTETLEERVYQELEKNASQQKQLFAQSRLAQMGEMISMIAHQWRQPLGAISTTASNLKLKLELDLFDLSTKEGIEEAQQYFSEKLDNIENFVQNLTTTIDDFRNFYKPNKRSVLVNIKAPFEKALKIIEASFLADGIEIIKEYKSQKEIHLYQNEIMQVILNILKNSQDNFREQRTKKPKIYLSCQDTEDGINIQICDNGGGIHHGIIDKVFDPYFSTKHEKNGTGLGLYMSKIIIDEHHNGHLSVKNEGEGVCFKINIDNGELNE